jgi:hypothetical protein
MVKRGRPTGQTISVLTNNYNVELESSFEQFVFDLAGDGCDERDTAFSIELVCKVSKLDSREAAPYTHSRNRRMSRR